MARIVSAANLLMTRGELKDTLDPFITILTATVEGSLLMIRFQFIEQIQKYLDDHSKVTRSLFNDQNHIEEAKKRFLLALPFWFAGLLTALFATLYARVFSFFEQESIHLYASLGYWALLAVPIFFLLSWYVVERFAPFSNGSGIPQLMAAAEISQHTPESGFIRSLLGAKIIFFKILSSLMGVLGGGAIGREGPTLQIAGSIFHLTGMVFPKNLFSKNHHGLILAGGAAGLASAFNTPMGGIAYVMEELSRSHLSSFRTGILHAVIVAGLISQLVMGPYLYLGYPKVEVIQLSQLGLLVGISILVGLLVAFFGQSLKLVVIFRSELSTPMKRAILALVCGFCFAAFAIFASRTVVGSGKEILNELLFTTKKASFLDVFSRYFGSVVTYSTGGAGGIFAPTLSLGGAAASYMAQLFHAEVGPLVVLVGMTAALSALTQSPFTSFVLILEMTDRHSAIFPLMIAALLGQGVSRFVSKHSFYEFVFHRILSDYQTTQERGGVS